MSGIFLRFTEQLRFLRQNLFYQYFLQCTNKVDAKYHPRQHSLKLYFENSTSKKESTA